MSVLSVFPTQGRLTETSARRPAKKTNEKRREHKKYKTKMEDREENRRRDGRGEKTKQRRITPQRHKNNTISQQQNQCSAWIWPHSERPLVKYIPNTPYQVPVVYDIQDNIRRGKYGVRQPNEELVARNTYWITIICSKLYGRLHVNCWSRHSQCFLWPMVQKTNGICGTKGSSKEQEYS